MSDALINGLAGAGGGIIAQLITYPLQTVSGRDPVASTQFDLVKFNADHLNMFFFFGDLQGEYEAADGARSEEGKEGNQYR